MSTTTIILAAGNQTRWALGGMNLRYKIKQLVSISGTPLITRISRQVKGVGYLMTKEPKIAAASSCKTIVPEKSLSIVETLQSSSHLWHEDNRIVILLGDVYYTDKAITQIYNCTDPYMFFGNSQEIFALVFNDSLYIRQMLAIIKEDEYMLIRKMKLWHLYRFMQGFKPDEVKIKDGFTFINDSTTDFDDWRQYEKWLKRKKKKL